ncbi:MAG TPA: NlpC/P60 family protein [Chitinophagaceae bacterium]|nr:NlpC/P60 family protein [Chitinophagaceae bacterium]
MVKNTLPLVAILFFLASCSSLKPLGFTANKQVITAPENDQAQTNKSGKKQVQFLDDISVTPSSTVATQHQTTEESKTRKNTRQETAPAAGLFGDRSAAVEKASSLQLKYSILLNTEVEQLNNHLLLENIDAWYGTRYRLGGTTKKGVDCSALVQSIFLGAYAVSLPRTAREQYRFSRRISRTDLKEGDLLFFNTTGGISHVGIYLQNNKFVHASASQGVTVSDMFDPYYLRRFIGAGRVDEKQQGFSSN